MKCLVLGGCGFIGSHLVDHLVYRGDKVVVFDRLNVDTKNIDSVLGNIELVRGDFRNREDIKRTIKNIDYIFHFIGTTLPETSTQNPMYDIESNVISTIQLLEVIKGTNVKKIIFASSGGTIYGIPQQIPIPENHPTNPICSYGISKLMIEKYLRLYGYLYGLDYVSLRFANAYGERQDPKGSQGVIPVFLGNIIKGQPIHVWGDGNVVRDYIHVKDIVNACQRAMQTRENEYHIFNIGSGKGLSLNELISILKETVKNDIQVRYTIGRKIDVSVNILDNRLAKEILEWQPKVSLEEGLQLTAKYLNELSDL